ncbi:uncharacterized protein LOC134855032 [Symsagittifera roscoffensis]|uniref:uncharacterized protein LOC134855032 n=1 Tax=Symsagittifera roscoffensis TaxID=84072 RepID=UPI00307C8EE7
MPGDIKAVYPYAHTIVNGVIRDTKYPGTACHRMLEVHRRLKSLPSSSLMNRHWKEIRSTLLWCGGLLEDRSTSHAFNDDNHCDLTTMLEDVQSNSNENGLVKKISRKNFLGDHIKKASVPDLGEGGSWSTCTNGCDSVPPNDVAHAQFNSRIAFKLVWCPPCYETFVLVDDEGKLLKVGQPIIPDENSTSSLVSAIPDNLYRKSNFALTKGGIYATVAEGYRNKGPMAGT